MNHRVLVVTTTFYQSMAETRYKLALETVKKTKEKYRMLIVDGSPDPKIKETFHELGAKVIHQQKPGMGASRRQLFELAHSITDPGDVIFWVEPEKPNMIDFIPELVLPIFGGFCSISIPVRTKKSWESYPELQQISEAVVNQVFEELTGLQVDIMVGPMAIERSALPDFFGCFPEKFGVMDNYVQHIAVIVAWKNGHKILSPGVPVDFIYPPEQKQQEEGPLFREIIRKRLWQLKQLIEADFKVSKFLGSNKESVAA